MAGNRLSCADVVIVGAGIVGCAAAYYLAKRGCRVVVCEKGEIGGEQSTRNWGFVRQQGRDPAEIQLMTESIKLWAGLEEELGHDVGWTQAGNIALAEDHTTLERFHAWLDLTQPYRLSTRIASPEEVARLIPGLRGTWEGGLYTPSDGQAEPVRTVEAFQHAARDLGVHFETRCAVDTISHCRGRVTGVVTERGEFEADNVVCAAGAWACTLLRPLGIFFPQLWLRGSVARSRPIDQITRAGIWAGVAFRQDAQGRLIFADGRTADHDVMPDTFRYANAFLSTFRTHRKELNLKFGATFFTHLSSLWRRESGGRFRRFRINNPQPHERRLAGAAANLQSMFPEMGTGLSVERTWAGYIDVTPDMLPVVERLQRPEGLVVAAGFSGHGFGMGPVIGRIVAELVSEGETTLDISPLCIDRFLSGRATPRNLL